MKNKENKTKKKEKNKTKENCTIASLYPAIIRVTQSQWLII